MSTESDNTSKPQRQPKRKPPSIEDIRQVNISDGVRSVEGNADKPNGSSVKPLYKHRSICYYPVTEDELEQIASFNRISALFLSVGSFLFGLTVDVMKDIYSSSDMAAATQEKLTSAVVAALIISVICYGLGFYFQFLKTRSSNKIKSEASDD